MSPGMLRSCKKKTVEKQRGPSHRDSLGHKDTQMHRRKTQQARQDTNKRNTMEFRSLAEGFAS